VGWEGFVASLVQSLAWPAAAATAVIVLRKPIVAAFSQGVRRVKAGPVEVEFDQVQAEVREELARSPELAEAQVQASAGSVSEDLSGLAEIAPGAAVMNAYHRIEARLTEIIDSACPGERSSSMRSGRALARMARERGLISEETAAAIEGLSVLRNLTAHAGGEISSDRARDYLALSDAVLYALRSKPPS
jgi:hypothetical protein